MSFDLGRVDVRKRNPLPHWDVEHGIHFVTFNLFDAVPLPMRERIRQEADAQRSLIRAARGQLTQAEAQAIDQWVHARIGDSLDESQGTCFMREPRIAHLVASAITFFDEERYRLLSWTVMPNHAHVVLTVSDRLDRVIHSWKSYTAKTANRVLGRTGPFWQDDYYDRVARDERELACTIDYVLENPMKAGLKDWPWVRAYPERLAEFVPPGKMPGGSRAGRPPHA
jgi:REP element-mobilizing transposase RayT